MTGPKRGAAWRDARRVLKLGVLLDAACFLILFAAGLLAQGFAMRAALQVVRSGLFILGALALLVVAGLLFFGGGKADVRASKAWQRHFERFGFLPVAAGLGVIILFSAAGLDYLLYYVS